MKSEIGAYEAKTRLPELLREVRAGKRFTITNRGEAIADLVPSAIGRSRDPVAGVAKFRAFMRANPIKSEQKLDLKALIEEGRE